MSVSVNNDVIYLTSIYCAPSGDLVRDLAAITNQYTSLDKMIVAGDSNVPLLSLGYSRETERTDELLEFITNYDLHLVNDVDAPPTFTQGIISGRPDLTISGLNILSKINNWHVDVRNYSFSDHRYILSELDFNILTTADKRFKTKNKCFYNFNNLVRSNSSRWLADLRKVNNTVDLDVHVNTTMNELFLIAESCFRLGDMSYLLLVTGSPMKLEY